MRILELLYRAHSNPSAVPYTHSSTSIAFARVVYGHLQEGDPLALLDSGRSSLQELKTRVHLEVQSAEGHLLGEEGGDGDAGMGVFPGPRRSQPGTWADILRRLEKRFQE